MECNIVKVESRWAIGLFKNELKLKVSDIKDDFKLIDMFEYNGREIKVYRNSEKLLKFIYASFDIFSNDTSKIVPSNAINHRIKTSTKYKFDRVYKLDTNNPSDNYFVSMITLLRLIGTKYIIKDDLSTVNAFKIYNE